MIYHKYVCAPVLYLNDRVSSLFTTLKIIFPSSLSPFSPLFLLPNCRPPINSPTSFLFTFLTKPSDEQIIGVHVIVVH